MLRLLFQRPQQKLCFETTPKERGLDIAVSLIVFALPFISAKLLGDAAQFVWGCVLALLVLLILQFGRAYNRLQLQDGQELAAAQMNELRTPVSRKPEGDDEPKASLPIDEPSTELAEMLGDALARANDSIICTEDAAGILDAVAALQDKSLETQACNYYREQFESWMSAASDWQTKSVRTKSNAERAAYIYAVDHAEARVRLAISGLHAAITGKEEHLMPLLDQQAHLDEDWANFSIECEADAVAIFDRPASIRITQDTSIFRLFSENSALLNQIRESRTKPSSETSVFATNG